jgi:hypothetical protein
MINQMMGEIVSFITGIRYDNTFDLSSFALETLLILTFKVEFRTPESRWERPLSDSV